MIGPLTEAELAAEFDEPTAPPAVDYTRKAAPEPVDDRVVPLTPARPARPATDADLSKTALALRKAALAAGWRVRADYAQAEMPVKVMRPDPGAPPTKTGKVAKKRVIERQAVASIVLRLESPSGASAVVVYEGGKPIEAYVWATGLDGVTKTDATTVVGLVKGTWPVPVGDVELVDVDEQEVAA